MNFRKIEDDALNLSKEERTQLVQKLILSLESPSKAELESDWLSLASTRAEELDKGDVKPVPGHEVMQKAWSLIK